MENALTDITKECIQVYHQDSTACGLDFKLKTAKVEDPHLSMIYERFKFTWDAINPQADYQTRDAAMRAIADALEV